MGVFVSYGLGTFDSTEFVTKTDKAFQDSLRAEMKRAAESGKRLNARWTTVVPTQVNEKLDPNYQLANCIENLKVMSEVCEPSGLVMVLEPLNWHANHPRLFLRSVPQAYAICKAVGSFAELQDPRRLQARSRGRASRDCGVSRGGQPLSV